MGYLCQSPRTSALEGTQPNNTPMPPPIWVGMARQLSSFVCQTWAGTDPHQDGNVAGPSFHRPCHPCISFVGPSPSSWHHQPTRMWWASSMAFHIGNNGMWCGRPCWGTLLQIPKLLARATTLNLRGFPCLPLLVVSWRLFPTFGGRTRHAGSLVSLFRLPWG